MSVALLVTGAGGQLGADLLRVAGPAAHGVARADLDVTDPAMVDKAVESWAAAARPGADRLVCLNAAAYTAVDAAETDAEQAHAVNATGAANVAQACARHGVRLVHVSTDYVFAGDAAAPYQVDAPNGPATVYGASKLAGERAVLAAAAQDGAAQDGAAQDGVAQDGVAQIGAAQCWVVRTAWVYGQTGGNFVKTMARLERTRDTLDVVDDQRGSPTWSRDLARGLVSLAGSDAPYGVYHCTNGGDTTWYGLARAVFEELGADPARVRPASTAAFPRPAPRPAYSVLSDAAWRGAALPPLPHWRDALAAAFATAGAALRGG
jgi:dTDP-4-dehydrorhamnose reductase